MFRIQAPITFNLSIRLHLKLRPAANQRRKSKREIFPERVKVSVNFYASDEHEITPICFTGGTKVCSMGLSYRYLSLFVIMPY